MARQVWQSDDGRCWVDEVSALRADGEFWRTRYEELHATLAKMQQAAAAEACGEAIVMCPMEQNGKA